MIYTIGNCKNYDRHLTDNNLSKAKGGTVWKKFSDVLEYFKTCKVYIDDQEVESAIYIVDGDWDKDVERKKNNQGELNKPCKIIKKL
jgi:hypothetical protein